MGIKGVPLRFCCLVACLSLLCPLTAIAQKAVDFTLRDLSGEPHKLSGYFPEHVVLLNFWATWCVPCVEEFPHFERLQDQYKTKGLKILAVSVDGPERAAGVSSFVGRYGYTFTVLLDPESLAVSLYNPRLVLPYSVLIDRQGRIRYVHQGYSPGDERPLEQEIMTLLAEPETRPGAKTSLQANESFLLKLAKKGFGPAGQPDEYSQVINQLDLTASRGGVLAGVRVDSSLRFSPSETNFSLAKRFAQYSTEGFRARAGDFYYSLGRGLVFSLLKVFEAEGLDYVIDTTVDGGLASVGSGPLAAGVFGGWIDRPEDHRIKDRVAGGSVGWGRPNLGAVRFQGISADLAPEAEFGNHRVDQGSLSLEFSDISGQADVYAEFSLIKRWVYDAPEPISGHGLYVESKLRLGQFSLLLELQDYKELNFEYSRPPLLEEEGLDILADQFATDRTNITGYSARLDYYSPSSRTLLYGNFLIINDEPDDHRLYGSYDREIRHLFAGVEKRFADGGYLNALAGWRSETDTSIAFMGTDGETFHYQVNASQPIGRGLSLEADWKHKIFAGRYFDYSEVRSALSLHKSPRWVLTALFEWTSAPEAVLWAGRRRFFAAQVEVKSARGHSLRLFVGSTKGSTKCAGGVCRLFPPFEGVRLDGILRF